MSIIKELVQKLNQNAENFQRLVCYNCSEPPRFEYESPAVQIISIADTLVEGRQPALAKGPHESTCTHQRDSLPIALEIIFSSFCEVACYDIGKVSDATSQTLSETQLKATTPT